MFRAAEAMVVTKLDLLPHVPTVSAVSGQGLSDWYGWLAEQAALPAAPISPAPAVAGTARPTS